MMTGLDGLIYQKNPSKHLHNDPWKHIQMIIYDELAAELWVDSQAHPQHSSPKFNLHSNISHLFWLNSGEKNVLSH